TFPTQGQVFGPFICRNHFPFYANLCLGLGLGLLLARERSRAGRPRRGLLHDPAALWVAGGLVVGRGAVVPSLSRGGLLALAGALGVPLVLAGSRATPPRRLGAVGLVVAAAALLGGQVGLGPVGERWAALWRGQTQGERLPVWSDVLPLAAEFPVWGTGL